MMNGKAGILALSVLAMLTLAGAASAAINTINTGNTVFLGEQGLDISGVVGGSTQLGWWASGAAIGTTSPNYTYVVSSPTSFFVSPAEFGSRTGSWYVLPAKTTAFTVADPFLNVKIEDTIVNVDMTNKWVPRGDDVRFGVESNLYSMTQRPGVASVPVTLKVRGPVGEVFTSLVNSAGASSSIVDLPITSSQYYTGSIWNTGNSLYPDGNYAVWAECNVNNMKDNYNVAGKTVSQQYSVLNQDRNPLITAKTSTKAPTTVPTTKTPAATPTPTLTPTPSPTPTAAVTTAIPTTDSAVPTTSPATVSPAVTLTESAATPQPTLASGFGIAGCAIAILACCGLLLKRRKD
jgi:hypothetical protein